MAVEEKQGISRLEQVVEEISEAERAKELRREQKRLKKKAKRKEKCKCHAQLTISTANNELKTEETAKNEEELEEEVVCVNENVEETEEMNGHGDSCEDDEDDGDSGGSPCSCEDLSNCERRKNKKSGYRNGDCGCVSLSGYRARVLKGWRTLSSGKITVQWIKCAGIYSGYKFIQCAQL